MEKGSYLSDELVWSEHDRAANMGFWGMSHRPGYDQIGMDGEAYLIDRTTKSPLIIQCKIIEREGRPFVRIHYPNKDYKNYMLIGWRPKK